MPHFVFFLAFSPQITDIETKLQKLFSGMILLEKDFLFFLFFLYLYLFFKKNKTKFKT